MRIRKDCDDDLKQYLGIPEKRLHVIPNALHWPYKPMSADACAPFLTSAGLRTGEPYFFHLGGNHWYKNRGAAIEIFAELRKLPQFAGARLVMAGGPMKPELRTIVQKHQLGGVLLEGVGLSHEHLQALYSSALALLFPSLEEGFGWPILEAQACGCPVVTTDRPPMNVVADGAAILIDPANRVSGSERLRRHYEDTARLRNDGLRNAASHTPDRMLEQCEALYREVIAARMPK